MAQYELNLRDYWLIIRKRKWIVTFTVLLVSGSTWFMGQMSKPQLLYDASVRVKFERSTAVSGLMTEVMEFSEGHNITTQAEVIRSVPVLVRAAQKLGMVGVELDARAARLAPEVLVAVYDLKDKVEVAQELGTSILAITATANGAEQAAQFANAVAEAYREENIVSRNRQVDEAKQFVEAQLQTTEVAYRQSENTLLLFKEREGNVFLAEEAREALARYSGLETERDKLAQVGREVAEQLRMLQASMASPGAGGVRIFSDDVEALIAKLNQKLSDLTTERTTLLVHYTPQHPQVVELDARIQGVMQEMARDLEAKLQTFKERERTLHEAIGRYKERYIGLPKASLELSSLEREVKVNGDLYANLKHKNQEFLIKGAERIEEVTVIEPAVPPGAPKNPQKPGLNFMLGSLIGGLLGVVLAFIRESFDTSIGTIEDVEAFLHVPVLGVLPTEDRKEIGKMITETFPESLDPASVELLSSLSPLFDLNGLSAEGYRSLKVNLQFACQDREVKSLAFASAGLGEGKTTTVLNLAITIAQDGRRVLIVDADLRKPTVHSRLGLAREPGLSEVLVGQVSWQDVVQTTADLMLGKLGFDQVLSAPGVDNLSILTCGHTPPNPSEFFNSQRIVDLITDLEAHFDLVIFDCPPILPVADALLIGPKVDGVVLVYQVGKVGRTPLLRAKTLLENAQAQIIGTVLSNVSAEYSPDYYKYSYYKYSS